jgi:hypothetical protein
MRAPRPGQIEIDTDCLKVLDCAQQVDERASEPIDGPRHHDIEIRPTRIFEHAIEAGALSTTFGSADTSIPVDFHNFPAAALRRMCEKPRISWTSWSAFLQGSVWPQSWLQRIRHRHDMGALGAAGAYGAYPYYGYGYDYPYYGAYGYGDCGVQRFRGDWSPRRSSRGQVQPFPMLPRPG